MSNNEITIKYVIKGQQRKFDSRIAYRIIFDRIQQRIVLQRLQAETELQVAKPRIWNANSSPWYVAIQNASIPLVINSR